MAQSRPATLLQSWVDRIGRSPGWTLLAALAVATVLSGLAFQRLGVDTNTEDMLSERLEWRQDFARFKAAFPHFNEAIVVVVEGRIPEQAYAAAAALTRGLEAEPELFRRVEWLGGTAFFRRHGLLYLSAGELDDLGDRLARVQGLLARLAWAPHLAGLADLLELAVEEESEALAPVLDDFLVKLFPALRAAGEGEVHPLSWQAILGGDDPGKPDFELVVVDPAMEFDAVLPGAQPIERIRTLARRLVAELGPGVRIRLTGPTPLMHEELQSVSRGAVYGGIVALVLVSLVLCWALRSWRLIAATLVTLLAGLGSTAGFAALAVGQLNLISVAFAVLYIGLGVDFAIHYCLRYRELRVEGVASADAISRSTADVGVALLLCALTTSLGFFAFLPTDFQGVAELGLISGVGVYISLAASLTILPAMLALLPIPQPCSTRSASWPLHTVPQRHYRAVIGVFVALAVAASVLAPRLDFDSDPMNLRDPDSESVATFFELMKRSPDPPLSISILAADPAQAAEIQDRLRRLETVASTRSLDDFVPSGQSERLARIEDIRWLLGPLPTEVASEAPPQPDLARFAAVLEGHQSAAADRLIGVLERLERDLNAASDSLRDELLRTLHDNLFGYFPAALQRLTEALEAAPVDRSDLPPMLRENWVGRDGLHRVAVYPAGRVSEPGALAEFVREVRAEAPGATGLPVVYYRAGQSVQTAFREALILAALAIAVVLATLLRSVLAAGIVLLPIAVAALMTAGLGAAFGLTLTFANVIALPLLFGVGVDSSIHMIHRMRFAPPRSGLALQSSTAGGVFFSALTTTVSFGNLAFSAHPGTASMGKLLVMGMICMTVVTLLLLPALLAALDGWRARRAVR